MKDQIERVAVALLKRVEDEAERADLSMLADLANVAAKFAEVAQGKKETAREMAVVVNII